LLRDTIAAPSARKGNIGVKMKTLSTSTLIVDATKSTNAIMSLQMKDISDASLQTQRSKIEVLLKLFEEQMTYQREKDKRLHETALVTYKNTRLAILKQHKMVRYLQQLITVLDIGMSLPIEVGKVCQVTTEHNSGGFCTPDLSTNSSERVDQQRTNSNGNPQMNQVVGRSGLHSFTPTWMN